MEVEGKSNDQGSSNPRMVGQWGSASKARAGICSLVGQTLSRL